MAVAEDPDQHLTDERVGGRVVRGGYLRVGSTAVANLLVAGGGILLLHYLSPSDFGRYGTVMALAAIVQGVTDAGLTITGTRELSLVHGDERRTLLAHILGLRIVLTVAGVLLAVAFAALVGYDGQLVVGTALAGAAVFLLSIQGVLLLPMVVALRQGTVAISEVLRQATLVVAWVVLVLVGAGLDAFFAVQVVAAAVILAVTPFLVGRRHVVRPRWNGRELRALAAVGLPVAIASIVAIVYYRVLTVIASLLTTDTQTGLFVAASRVFEITYAIPLMLVTIILPVMTVLARDDRVRLGVVGQRMTEAMALGGLAAALIVAGAAEPILLVLGGEDYRAAAPALRVLAIALVSMFIGASWSPLLIATGRQKLLAISSGVGLVVTVVLGCVLIPGGDARGAAEAFAVADWVLLGAMYVALRRAGSAGHLDVRFLWRLAPLTAVAAAVVFAPWGPAAVTTTVGVLLFASGAFALRLVPTEFLHALRRPSG